METPRVLEQGMDKVWIAEDDDKLVPQGGFIQDMVLATRGSEAPVLSWLWCALMSVSAIIKRNAWIKWGHKKLYPNLFTIIVGGAGSCKSYVVDFHGKLIQNYWKGFDVKDPVEKFLSEVKKPTVLLGRATPEGMFRLMSSMKTDFVLHTAKGIKPYRNERGESLGGQHINLAVDDLPLFLGKQEYNKGLSTFLLGLYDSKDEDNDLTAGNGLANLRNVYVTIFTAANPEELREAIPPSAFGEGLVSRFIFLYPPMTERKFRMPVDSGVATESLYERLRWIAKETFDKEYTLSPEADQFYSDWYDTHWDEKRRGENPEAARLGVNLLKIATILRIQRYEPGCLVEVKDLEDALSILKATSKTSRKELTRLKAGNPNFKHQTKIEKYLRKFGEVNRAKMTSWMSYDCNVKTMNEALEQMIDEGHVEVEFEGKLYSKLHGKSKEIYRWIGGKE